MLVGISNPNDPFCEALRSQRASVRIQRSASAMAHYGALLQLNGSWKRSLAWLNRSVRLYPNDQLVNYLRGCALLRFGRWKEGLPLFENRLSIINNPLYASAPKWDGRSTDKVVLVWQDGGYGDAMMFVRYWPEALRRAPNTVLTVDKHLEPLLVANYPGTKIVHGRAFKYDMQAPIMSLLCLFNIAPSDITGEPYLHATNSQDFYYQCRLSSKIGFVWRGSPKNERDLLRTMPPEAVSLFDKCGIDVLSLQPEHQRLINTWADTANIVHHLDLVITVDTAIAHLAGAMGKSVWMIITPDNDWRWGDEGDITPWYNSMRLFRLKRHGDWKSTCEEVIRELRSLHVNS